MAKGRIVVKEDLCKGCDYCQSFCPKDCIEMGVQTNANGHYFAVFSHPDQCNGCAICATMCPDYAIEVYKQ